MTSSLAALVLVFAILTGCSSDPDPTASQQYLDLKADFDEVVAERDDLAARIEEVSAPSDDVAPIVAEFEAAYESGDLEAVRALYTPDGIWSTTGNVFELYYDGDFHRGTWGLDGSEFRRVASIHEGDLEIIDPVAVSDRAVAFGWAWEDFASGTATLHLRDGRIAVATLTVTEFEIPERSAE